MRRPILVLAVCLGLGCLVGTEGGLSPGLLAGLAGVAMALALASGRPSWAAAALAAGALGVGAAAGAVAHEAHQRMPLVRWMAERGEGEAPVRLVGTAAEDGREWEGRTLLVLDVASITEDGVERAVPGRVRVVVRGEAACPPVAQGDRVAVWAQVRAPAGFRNPGQPDAVTQARHAGIHAVAFCKSGRLVSVVRRGEGGLLNAATDARQAARRRLLAFVPAGPEQGVVRAMVLGDRAGLDRDTLEAFRAAGTYHVLAISGTQVALVAGLLAWTLRRLRVGPELRAAVVSLCVVFYATLVGGDVAVVRAAVMAVVVLLGRAIDLDADLPNLLGLAALLLLAARPADVFDVGFQLSFAATLGLLVLSPPLMRLLPRGPLGVGLAIAASVAAQLAIAPLLAVHFHRLAPAAVVLNLVAVPLSTAVLLLGAATVLASLALPPLAGGLGQLAWAAARALLASGFSAPALDPRSPAPATWVLALHLLGLLLLAGGRRAVAAVVLAASLACLAGVSTPSGRGRLELTVLDVGQGDCLVLRSPGGRTLLVDAGGSYDRRFDVGAAVVAPYLWSRGISSIDTIVVTHAHPDHVGGVPFLLRAFRVGELWEGVAPRRDPGYEALDRELRARGIPRRSVGRGVAVDWDGVRIEVLGPAPAGPAPASTRNDDSLVLRVGFGRVRLLLTGDVEASGEAVLASGPVDVLKVPHHGSRTSSSEALLAAARPRLAVVSVGARSPFGHPHPDVLARYRSFGVPLLRTDRDGAVTVSTDGTSIRVLTASAASELRVQ